jgi:hypothetical protein
MTALDMAAAARFQSLSKDDGAGDNRTARRRSSTRRRGALGGLSLRAVRRSAAGVVDRGVCSDDPLLLSLALARAWAERLGGRRGAFCRERDDDDASLFLPPDSASYVIW